MHNFVKAKKQEIIKFVKAREAKGGGYGLVRIIPPDLEDTYYALRIFQLFGIKTISPKTRRYLISLAKSRHSYSWRLAYHLIVLLKQYHLQIPDQCTPRYVPDPLIELYYCTSAYQLLRKRLTLDPKVISHLQRQTPRTLKYLEEINRYILLVKRLKLPIDAKMFRDWILNRQCPYGGFTSVIDTAPSFMEDTYYALRALGILKAKPLNLEKCKEFLVTSFVKKEGGFGRQFNTVPTPQYTYYAITSLNILAR
jgi:hypothetical protein